MTQPGIEPWSPGLLANTLPTWPIFLLLRLGDILKLHWSDSPKEMSSSAKCNFFFFVFLIGGIVRYLVDIFIRFIILLIGGFLKPTLADGFPLKSEWQQISASRQYSPQYYCRSQQCSNLGPLISKSSSLCTNPLVTVASAPITIGITSTFMFHSFFISLAKSTYLSLLPLSFSFTLRSVWTARLPIRQVLSFFFLSFS